MSCFPEKLGDPGPPFVLLNFKDTDENRAVGKANESPGRSGKGTPSLAEVPLIFLWREQLVSLLEPESVVTTALRDRCFSP